MAKQDSDQPLLHDLADKKFNSVWHAEVFALTVALHQAGVFSWPEWTAFFAAHIQDQPSVGVGDHGDDAYYLAWLAALTQLLAERNITMAEEIGIFAEKWRQAYLLTPHGHPVRLS